MPCVSGAPSRFHLLPPQDPAVVSSGGTGGSDGGTPHSDLHTPAAATDLTDTALVCQQTVSLLVVNTCSWSITQCVCVSALADPSHRKITFVVKRTIPAVSRHLPYDMDSIMMMSSLQTGGGGVSPRSGEPRASGGHSAAATRGRGGHGYFQGPASISSGGAAEGCRISQG